MARVTAHQAMVLVASLAIGGLATTLAPIGGQAAPSTYTSGRYSLSPTEGGFLRLDRQTGAMALCSGKDDTWSCRPVEDAATRNSELEKLKTENDELKERVKTLEEMVDARAGVGAETDVPQPPTPPPNAMQLPSEEDVDKALDYVENIFKKFRDRVRKYESKPDGSSDQPNDAPADGKDASPAPGDTNEPSKRSL